MCRFITKLTVITILSAIAVFNSEAQVTFAKSSQLESIQKSLEKNNKDFIKSLKKELGYNSVKLWCDSPQEYYYVVTIKENGQSLSGVLDKNGNKLIDVLYNSIIIIPSTRKGELFYTYYQDRGGTKGYSAHVNDCGVRFVAVGDKGGRLFDINGNTIFESNNPCITILPGFVVFHSKKMPSAAVYFLTNDFYNITDNIDLSTFDGSIQEKGLISLEFNSAERKYYPEICKIKKKFENDYVGEGEFHVPGKRPYLPPLFVSYYWDDKQSCYFVNQKDIDSKVPFNPTINYGLPSYEDDGEYFEQVGKYDKAIEYYEKKDSLTSIDAFRAGLSYEKYVTYDLPSKYDYEYIGITDSATDWWNNNHQAIEKKLEDNFYEQHLAKAYDYYGLYLSMDTTYQSFVILRQNRLKDLEDKVESIRNIHYAKLQSIVESNYRNSFEYQLKVAVANKVADAVGGVIESGLNSLTSHPKRKQTVYRTSSVRRGVTVSEEENSVNTKELSPQVESQIRKIEGYINDEKQRLEDATRRYQSEPSVIAKSAIEAHKKAIQGYYKQINDLRK